MQRQRQDLRVLGLRTLSKFLVRSVSAAAGAAARALAAVAAEEGAAQMFPQVSPVRRLLPLLKTRRFHFH